MMPHDLPPWSTCYDYFRKWRNNGTWEWIMAILSCHVTIKPPLQNQ
jgi:transposase